MEALASLAMAAERLEEGETAQRFESSFMKRSSGAGAETNLFLSYGATSPSPTGVVLPSRISFETPRVVSVDSSVDSYVSLNEFEGESKTMEETIVDFDASHLEPPPPPPSPDEIITKVLKEDVLCGRGGETNHWCGNVLYRGLVKKYQRVYLKAKRRDKPKIARLIVDEIRRGNGRFLKKVSGSNTWRDVGNTKAREKTSQALREGAPEIRNEDGSSGEEGSLRDAPQQPHLVESIGEAAHLLPKHQPKKRKLDPIHLNPMARLQLVDPTLVSPTPSSSSFQDTFASPVATVSSADDDESSLKSTGDFQSSESVRGPRLAILKKRLMLSKS